MAEAVFDKSVAASFIPDDFITRFIENEAISENKFRCVVRVNVCDGNSFSVWLKEFEAKTNTTWILRRSSSCSGENGYVFSRDYVCQHASFGKRKKEEGKTAKDKTCEAMLSIRIKRDTKYTRCRDNHVKDGLLSIIRINFNHSHIINVAEGWNWLRRSADMKVAFIAYFENGMSPAAAKMYHEDLIIAEDPHLVANSRVNPPPSWIYVLHEKWRKENYGGVKSCLDLLRIATLKAEQLRARGYKISIKEDPFCIAVVTPIMSRTLGTLDRPSSFFVDSSASCDQASSSVTVVLVSTKSGAVPVGVCIHSSQTEESYVQAFTALNLLWENASCKIENFMTDDGTALKNALTHVFPEIRQLLCLFHVPQALWRWLWNGKNSVALVHRKELMLLFRQVMYAIDVTEFNSKVFDLLNNPVSKMYPHFLRHVDSLLRRKDEWCMCFRLDVKNMQHNTNNYAEATFRILKDVILSRLKAYNALALLDFVTNVMEKHYAKRLIEVACKRSKKGYLLAQKCFDNGKNVLKDCRVEKCQEFYLVQSQANKTKCYEVCAGLCSCPAGLQGAFCKHQAAVHLKFEVHFPNSPEITLKDRETLYYIAVGNVCKVGFFNGMTEADTSPEVVEIEEVLPVQQCTITTESVLPSADSSQIDHSVLDIWIPAMKHVHNLLVKGSSNAGMMKQAEKFAKTCQSMQTDMQLYSYLDWWNSRERHGKKIKVQPTSIARRKNGSKGSLCRPSGRPRKEREFYIHKRKRQRNLAKNINAGVPNAKTHGEGH